MRLANYCITVMGLMVITGGILVNIPEMMLNAQFEEMQWNSLNALNERFQEARERTLNS